MPDRTEIIDHLKVIWTWAATYNIRDADCPKIAHYVDDAIRVLEAQEPRVMTLEEAKNAYVIEYRSGKIREFGSELLDLEVDPLNAQYGKIYRVWTSRPTYEQREATAWND